MLQILLNRCIYQKIYSMPYFKDANLLFIHIPKTGGSSLEKYFSAKYRTQLNAKSLFMGLPQNIMVNDTFDRGIALQHQTYKSIYDNQRPLVIQINKNTKIITIVRNPYTRIISDLFYYKIISSYTDPQSISGIIKKYLEGKYGKLDNHPLPQYKFIIDGDGIMVPNLIIMRTEHLVDDMKKNGYTDFNIFNNVGSNSKENYMDYLNEDSINLINEIYDNDFILFGYQKIATTS